MLSLVQSLQQSFLLNDQQAINEDMQESNEKYRSNTASVRGTMEECYLELGELLCELEEEYYSSQYR